MHYRKREGYKCAEMIRSKLFMDTVVTIQILGEYSETEQTAAIDRAFLAFRHIEDACSRFSSESELMQVIQHVGKPVRISTYLFEPLQFALEVAQASHGLFDPTIGARMEQRGFNQHYLTRDRIHSADREPDVSYRDVVTNKRKRTVLFKKPVVIDLGAVAKGFAIDLAIQELRMFDSFTVNAGGDLYVKGLDARGERWKVGIQHPAVLDTIIETIEVSNVAVCTSGNYARPGHIVDPLKDESPSHWVSATVIAPYAMLADAFATVFFLLDADRGIDLLKRMGLRGILISKDLQIYRIGGINGDYRPMDTDA